MPKINLQFGAMDLESDRTSKKDTVLAFLYNGYRVGTSIHRIPGLVEAVGLDTSPDYFTFTAVTGAALSTETESPNTVTILGISAATAISVEAGLQYSKNGAAYTAVAGTVVLNDTVRVKLTSSSNYSTAVSKTLTVGDRTAAFSVTTAQSQSGVTWTGQTLPASGNWAAITFGNGVFVAVGQNLCATSPDGAAWTSRTIPNQYWLDVAWNGTVFCAIPSASNVAVTSPDGITWTQRTLPSSSVWTSIAWNGTVFCAIANGTVAATSPDGITWTPQTLPITKDWHDIAWNGTVFCAIPSTSGNVCLTSPDGITWTQRTLPVSTFWRAIAWSGTIFCVTTASNTVAATSPDGITWTQRTLPVSGNWNSIAWSDSVFCAMNNLPSVVALTSPDGITWTQRSIPVSGNWIDIAWNGTVFCAIASGGTVAATS